MDAKQKAAYDKTERLYMLREELRDRIREITDLLQELHPDPMKVKAEWVVPALQLVDGNQDFDLKSLPDLINEIKSSLSSE